MHLLIGELGVDWGNWKWANTCWSRNFKHLWWLIRVAGWVIMLYRCLVDDPRTAMTTRKAAYYMNYNNNIFFQKVCKRIYLLKTRNKEHWILTIKIVSWTLQPWVENFLDRQKSFYFGMFSPYSLPIRTLSSWERNTFIIASTI